MKGWKSIGAVLCIMFMIACSPRTEYTHALPKDASLVVSADLASMANKSKLNDDIIQKLGTLIRESMPDDASGLADKIMEDPSETGLSFTDKVYFFATPHANAIGMVARVESESKVKRLFGMLEESHLCAPPTEESGCQWVEIGNSICAFNNGTFLLMHNRTGGVGNIKGILFSLMRQKEGEGFSASEDFGQLSTSNTDIALLTDFSLMPDKFTTPLRMGLPADIRMEDIRYIVTANFEKGRIHIEAANATHNEAVQAFYQWMEDITQPVHGRFMAGYPANTLMWAGMNTNGKELYTTLCKNPSIRQYMNNPTLPVDVERIFTAINGDICIGMPSIADGGWISYAEVNGKDFLETFEELRPLLAMTGGQVTLHDTAPDQYALQTYNAVYWFGVKDDVFYVTNRKRMAVEAGRMYGVSLAGRPWAEETRKSRLSASFNSTTLATELDEYPQLIRLLVPGSAGNIVKVLANKCQDITLNSDKWGKVTLDIHIKDKQANVLETLAKTIGKL